jgi:hypothetical protein
MKGDVLYDSFLSLIRLILTGNFQVTTSKRHPSSVHAHQLHRVGRSFL